MHQDKPGNGWDQAVMEMNEEINIINETHICLLVKDTTTGRVTIELSELEHPFLHEFERLEELANNELNKLELDSQSVLNEVLDLNEKLGIFNIDSSYCRHLGAPFQNSDTLFWYKAVIEQRLESNYTGQQLERFKILEIKAMIAYSKKAWPLDEAYKKAKLNNNVIAYSHRQIGWRQPFYPLDSNLRFQFLTNFGYGWSSYFYVKLVYREIDIVPYSDLVVYRIAQAYDILRYTKCYYPRNEDWYPSMEFAQKAINKYLDNENEFVDVYIVSEIEQMVAGLEGVLTNSDFHLRDRLDEPFKNYTYKDRELIDYRGEKISGALAFIESIMKVQALVDVDLFIRRIESCCLAILPIVTRELATVSYELGETERSIEDLRPTYEMKKVAYEQANQVPAEIDNTLRSINYTSSEQLIDRIETFLVNYTQLKSKFELAKKDFYSAQNEWSQLHARRALLIGYHTKFQKYSSEIEHYFTSKREKVEA